MKIYQLPIGANFIGDKTSFRVWAPCHDNVKVQLGSRSVQLGKDDIPGYHTANVDRVGPNDKYLYVLGSMDEGLPDPASRFQPKGVHTYSKMPPNRMIHEPSEVIDPNSFNWTDQNWKGIKQEDLIIYELHVGTFTDEGTFEAAIEKIPYLKSLGVTCVELMPIAQFVGDRNWGYDGVNLFAPQNTYGRPEKLKQFINTCHENGIAVALDVVYNHMGPHGNTIPCFGPYVSSTHRTPWGAAYNFDGENNKPVRDYIIANAMHWIYEYHFDALRLDAACAMHDNSKKHIVAELQEEVQKLAAMLGRSVIVITESVSNNPKYIKPQVEGGYGVHADWAVDFQRALNVALTREKTGFYGHFDGVQDLYQAFTKPYILEDPIGKKGDKYTVKTNGLSGKHFVAYAQCHDTPGNHPLGHRLTHQASFESLKLAAAVTLLSPYVPMMFMGEEFAAGSPFHFFVNYTGGIWSDRKKGLEDFGWTNSDLNPDPSAIETFKDSKLRWRAQDQSILQLYKDLIQFRKLHLIPEIFDRNNMTVSYLRKEQCIVIEYKLRDRKRLAIIHSFSEDDQTIERPFNGKLFQAIINTENIKYSGTLKDQNKIYYGDIKIKPKSSMVGWLINATN